MVRLKGADVYTGGLDRREDTDGEYSLYWRSSMLQIMFHVVTLMPNQTSLYPQYQNKKRHIGNDNVHIVYSDNDADYRQDTISVCC